MLGKNYWNQRYIKNEIGWDIGEPSTPIITYINQVKNKDCSILVPGAGNAHEVEYIFNKGFKNVYGLDWASVALENFKSRCLAFAKQNMLNFDFFSHVESYNLIIEQTFFCALPLDLRTAYTNKVYELLSTGGKLIGLLFNKVFENEDPPFGCTKAEYTSLLEDKFNLAIMEDCHNSIKSRLGNELFIKFIQK